MLVICSISIHLSFTSIPPPLVHVVIGLIRFSVHLGLPSSSLLPSIGKSSPHFLFHASLLYSLSALLWCYLSLLLSDYFFFLSPYLLPFILASFYLLSSPPTFLTSPFPSSIKGVRSLSLRAFLYQSRVWKLGMLVSRQTFLLKLRKLISIFDREAGS